MNQIHTIRLPQGEETPLGGARRRRLSLRYAYARSADCVAAGEPGQDYLALREDGRRLAFALCDGVGQSFFGDLAARLLGERLLGWLWDEAPGADGAALADLLGAALDGLAGPASAQVAALPLPAGVPPMLRMVLEQKRALGSESTFACGLIDLRADRVLLAWMGDTRLGLWGAQGTSLLPLDAAFRTDERWSSRRGRVGQLHLFEAKAAEIQQMAVYSDGLSCLDAEGLPPDGASLACAIRAAGQAANSDDRSILEVWLRGLPPAAWLPAPELAGVGLPAQPRPDPPAIPAEALVIHAEAPEAPHNTPAHVSAPALVIEQHLGMKFPQRVRLPKVVPSDLMLLATVVALLLALSVTLASILISHAATRPSQPLTPTPALSVGTRSPTPIRPSATATRTPSATASPAPSATLVPTVPPPVTDPGLEDTVSEEITPEPIPAATEEAAQDLTPSDTPTAESSPTPSDTPTTESSPTPSEAPTDTPPTTATADLPTLQPTLTPPAAP